MPLSLVKEHCELTTELSDTLLQLYVDGAEARVAAYLNRPLDTLLDPIALPDAPDPVAYAAAIRNAILLYISDAVEKRGTLVMGTIASELPTADRLLYPYRIGLGV